MSKLPVAREKKTSGTQGSLDKHYSYLQDIKYCKLYICLNKYIVIVVVVVCLGLKDNSCPKLWTVIRKTDFRHYIVRNFL